MNTSLQKVGDLTFKEVSCGEDNKQLVCNGEWGSISVLDRVTSLFGWRDIETGYFDLDGCFWLASGNFDVRDFPELSIDEAIGLIKKRANTCIGIPSRRLRRPTAQEES